jgi:hypothetical protein
MNLHRLKIVSGGQTGADRAGLDWAIKNGIAHGGWCPKGRRLEDGTIPGQYHLHETTSSNYLQRTEWKLRDSDGTVKSTSPVVAKLARTIVDWFKAEAGAVGPAPLAFKRAEWVKWRGERVTQLVLDLSRTAKQSNPQLVISSSGGPSPFEFYGCYRDAGRWVAEGINDQVFPMNYTPDPAALSDLMALQTASAPVGKQGCIFPGLQIYASRVVDDKRVTESIAAGIVESELRVVQQQGDGGLCLFAYDYLSDEIIDAVRKFSH